MPRDPWYHDPYSYVSLIRNHPHRRKTPRHKVCSPSTTIAPAVAKNNSPLVFSHKISSINLSIKKRVPGIQEFGRRDISRVPGQEMLRFDAEFGEEHASHGMTTFKRRHLEQSSTVEGRRLKTKLRRLELYKLRLVQYFLCVTGRFLSISPRFPLIYRPVQRCSAQRSSIIVLTKCYAVCVRSNCEIPDHHVECTRRDPVPAQVRRCRRQRRNQTAPPQPPGHRQLIINTAKEPQPPPHPQRTPHLTSPHLT